MKYLSIDLGKKRIGLATSDEKGIVAQPFKTINRTSDSDTLDQLAQICIDEKIKKIVIGIPLSAPEETQEEYKIFAQKLHNTTTLEVITWDETFSTKQAQNMVAFADVASTRKKTRTHRDDVAAAIILQEYLDHE